MFRNNHSRRRGIAAIAGLGLVAAAFPATAGAADDLAADSTVDEAVLSALEDGGTADVWLNLDSSADVSAAYGMDWEERGDYVHDSLRAHAKESQADLVAQLEAEGAEFQTFWINNAIFVEGADADLVADVASEGSVASIGLDVLPELVEPVETGPTQDSVTLETTWGLDAINAPTIWDEYDQRGEGIVVGTFDTGVEASHPALVEKYRGTETGSDDYNWFDSTGASDTPADPHGHGTHVTGTMIGGEGENEIGVAPEAQFIGSTGCCITGADVVETFEWFAAPTPIGGGEGDPAMRPHIINNSWGYEVQFDSDDPQWAPIVDGMDSWSSFGIFHTWAASNDGPGCDTVMSPAWNDGAAYVVANFQEDGTIADSSSRGPGEDGEPGPDAAAPGTNVISSVPGGGYAPMTGTSMAAPHMAGAVALLWAEFPELEGDIPATVALLDEAAVDTEDPTCGGPIENNDTFGEGKLDLVALFEAAGGGDEPPPEVEIDRLAGENRYETAAAMAAEYEGVDTVYIASGEGYPDALSGSSAASQGFVPAESGVMATPDGEPAPVLLAQGDNLTNATRAALDDLGVSNVIILGGTSIIDESVEAELAEGHEVTRVAGEHRYDTAAELAKLFEPGADVVYVASGVDGAYPDALTGAALAGSQGATVLLTQTDNVPAATTEALEHLDADQVIVLGGTAAVSGDVYDELGASERLAGENRWETALEISGNYEADQGVVYVASGNDYPDALAASAAAGSVGAPVLLAQQNNVPSALRPELQRLSPERVVIVGGTTVISEGVEDQILALLSED